MRIRHAKITAASWRRQELQRKLIRVAHSSNVWAYAYNGDSDPGTLYIQFKGKNGGPGDLYAYYYVPYKVYKKWITAPSKGHFFWANIRDVYLYNKLTGDKRGKLKNAVYRGVY